MTDTATKPNGVFGEIDGKTMRWASLSGHVHAVEGSEVHRGIQLLWTQCGRHDVPGGKAWFGADTVTCPHCLGIARGEG